MKDDLFDQAYKNLNPEQKKAVDIVDGPVMVMAGPGTGKTEVLTLRIANILKKTDTPADGILCLTFTNSGVRAMRERLARLVGPEGSRVVISTFHSFSMKVIEEFYEVLGFDAPPKLIDDHEKVILIDEILEQNVWEYLRPRNGGESNFRDLKSIISLLKRERISPDDFRTQIEIDIRRIKEDKENLSSRGKSKGELKKDSQEKINRFDRTIEAVKFYEIYEEVKKERGLADYDDVLEYIVRLTNESTEVRDSLRERYLYVLVDEHQDSSGVQNEFIQSVWKETDKPNIFVVGDDRQLIYGFGGASLSHFESFADNFEAKIIPLIENYRSTQNILNAADTLLSSSIIKDKLKSNTKDNHPIKSVEAEYPRDEILSAGIEIKRMIEKGLSPHDCAVLVPKNAQVEGAISVLKDLGLDVAGGGKHSFFSLPETKGLIRALKVIASPYEPVEVAGMLLDPIFRVPVLVGHSFIKDHNRSLNVEKLLMAKGEIAELGQKLQTLIEESSQKNLYALVQEISKTLFLDNITEHKQLLTYIEVVRTMLHLVLSQLEKNPKLTLQEFITFIDRIESYKENIPLAIFEAESGVKVMTLHASKGLEFEFVWIAHLDESSLMKGKSFGFTLPEKLEEFAQKKDELSARRELYVAITRAKRFCTLSYARNSYTGGELRLARIIEELPDGTFEKVTREETESNILKHNPRAYVDSEKSEIKTDVLEEIKNLVKENYTQQKVAVTHLNNFFGCSWKWYFRNFLRVPEAESESLLFGDLVHRVIHTALLHRKQKINVKSELEKELNNLLIFDEHMRHRFIKDALQAIEGYIKEYLGEVAENISTEKSYSYVDPEFPHLTITGKIDLVESLSEGEVAVTDFKTGRAYSQRIIEKNTEEGRMSDLLRQLTMYSYLIERQIQEVHVSNSKLLFLEADSEDKDKLYETRTNAEHQSLLRNDILDFDEALESGAWTDRECHFKPNAFQKECEFCKLKDLFLK